MTEYANVVQVSAICTRPSELNDMAKDLRKFVRSLQKEFDYDVKFDVTVVVNPHGTDTAKEDGKPAPIEKKVGFKIVREGDE